MSRQSLSLYFGLKEGETADLEIISAAAIAWVETMRALAQSVDGGSDIKVDLVDVDQSSAIYNTVVEWFDRNVEPHLDRIAAGASKAAPRSRTLVLTLAAFTVTTVVPTVMGDGFNEDDRERAKRIEQQTKSPAVETARQKFYRAIEREPAIESIQIRQEPQGEPIVIVSKESFPVEGGLFALEEEGVQERITPAVVEVVLVKPALVHTPRTWTFKPDGLPEFDAVMRDALVLQAIEDKGFPAIMREGIRMTLRLEVKEVLVDGQWKLVRGGRSVMRVISPKID
ncbi:MAG: hypothetical protein ABL928_04160 [Sphingorhabdus sp.]